MSSPTGPIEAPPQPETEFDLYAFWILHRSKILMLLTLLLVGLLGYSIYEFTRARAETSAARSYASAKTADDFRKVMANHEGSVAAANARLVLANQLRDEKKYDESSAVLQEFIAKSPAHPLISGAWTSLAVNLEAQGKIPEALANYQKVSVSYPTSYSAPNALMAQARILKSQEKTDEARRIYDSVVTQFPDNLVAREAFGAMMQLPKPAEPEPAKADGESGAKPMEQAAGTVQVPPAPVETTPQPSLESNATPAPASPAPAAPPVPAGAEAKTPEPAPVASPKPN